GRGRACGSLPTGGADDVEVEDYAISTTSDAGARAALNLPPGGGNFILDVAGSQIRLRQGTTTLFATPLGTVSSLNITGSSSNDALTVDLLCGTPFPSGGV